MDISFVTYDKARKALIKSGIFKPTLDENGKAYRGVYRINEAIAWKVTSYSRRKLFQEGLVAKVTVDVVPASEARKFLEKSQSC